MKKNDGVDKTHTSYLQIISTHISRDAAYHISTKGKKYNFKTLEPITDVNIKISDICKQFQKINAAAVIAN